MLIYQCLIVPDLKQYIRNYYHDFNINGLLTYNVYNWFINVFQAANLDNMLSNTRNTSENAIQAANAYSDIVKAIEEATQAANDAKQVSDNALKMVTYYLTIDN